MINSTSGLLILSYTREAEDHLLNNSEMEYLEMVVWTLGRVGMTTLLLLLMGSKMLYKHQRRSRSRI